MSTRTSKNSSKFLSQVYQNLLIPFLESFAYESLVFKETIANLNVYVCSYELTEDNLSALDSLQNNILKREVKAFTLKNISGLNVFGNLIEELKKEEKERTMIRYRIDYDQYCKFHYMKEPGGQGLELIDKESIDRSNKVLNFMIKSLGKTFLSGKEITSIALPVNINDERTMLEM